MSEYFQEDLTTLLIREFKRRSEKPDHLFIDLVQKMLRPQEHERIDAPQAL
jgi:hypothetical protein